MLDNSKEKFLWVTARGTAVRQRTIFLIVTFQQSCVLSTTHISSFFCVANLKHYPKEPGLIVIGPKHLLLKLSDASG